MTRSCKHDGTLTAQPRVQFDLPSRIQGLQERKRSANAVQTKTPTVSDEGSNCNVLS